MADPSEALPRAPPCPDGPTVEPTEGLPSLLAAGVAAGADGAPRVPAPPDPDLLPAVPDGEELCAPAAATGLFSPASFAGIALARSIFASGDAVCTFLSCSPSPCILRGSLAILPARITSVSLTPSLRGCREILLLYSEAVSAADPRCLSLGVCIGRPCLPASCDLLFSLSAIQETLLKITLFRFSNLNIMRSRKTSL